jgi:hypothetical protein
LNCLIIIPVYKNEISDLEQKGLLQVRSILRDYDIVFVGPYGLNIDEYLKLIPNGRIIYFDTEYFTSIETYNKLMLSVEFYLKFIDYKYILLFQTDAYVFSNQLDFWCNQNYDYIGAPWIGKHFKKIFRNNSYLKLMPFLKHSSWYLKLFYGSSFRVGNGGLSLRKVSSMIKVLEDYKEIVSIWNINEDNFFGMYVPFHNKNFKIPGVKEAVSFAMENSPQKAFKLNNNKLPFGCHNWYNGMFVGFWSKYIKMQ